MERVPKTVRREAQQLAEPLEPSTRSAVRRVKRLAHPEAIPRSG